MHSKKKAFIKSTGFCMSHEFLNIQSYIKSISHEQNITSFYSLSVELPELNPLETAPARHITSPLLGDN